MKYHLTAAFHVSTDCTHIWSRDHRMYQHTCHRYKYPCQSLIYKSARSKKYPNILYQCTFLVGNVFKTLFQRRLNLLTLQWRYFRVETVSCTGLSVFNLFSGEKFTNFGLVWFIIHWRWVQMIIILIMDMMYFDCFLLITWSKNLSSFQFDPNRSKLSEKKLNFETAVISFSSIFHFVQMGPLPLPLDLYWFHSPYNNLKPWASGRLFGRWDIRKYFFFFHLF